MSSPTADLPRPSHPSLEAEDIERRRRLLRQWRRHSALIGVLRKLLPTLCVGILLAISAWATKNVLFGRGDGLKVQSSSQIRMLNPYLQGRTEKGQPYLVTAASAVRDSADTAKLTLEKPVLTLGAGGPTWTKVSAAEGVYREDNGLLDLRGRVTLDDYKGNHLLTEHAFVDTKKSNVEGETPIAGRGPLGAISASSYSLRDAGAYLHFEGRVKSRIEHASTFASNKAPVK
jgi:lipopolysaccharide export system protein LptC